MFDSIGLTAEDFMEAFDLHDKQYERLVFLAKRAGLSYTTLRNKLYEVGYEWIRPQHSTGISHTMKAYSRKPCVICGEDRTIDRAHIIENSDMGASSVGNIVHLCPTHHRLWDEGKLTQDESTELEYYFSNHIGETRAVGTSQRKRWIAKRYE